MFLFNMRTSAQTDAFNFWDLFHEVNNYVLHENNGVILNQVLQAICIFMGTCRRRLLYQSYCTLLFHVQFFGGLLNCILGLEAF